MTTLNPEEMRSLNTISEAGCVTYEANRRIEATMMELGSIPLVEAILAVHQWAGNSDNGRVRAAHARRLIDAAVQNLDDTRKLLAALNREMNRAVAVSDDERARRTTAGPTLNV